MKMSFVKEVTNETSNDKDKKIIFSGITNNVEYNLSIKGTDDEIAMIKNALSLDSFGEVIEIDLRNNQQKLNKL